MRYEDGRKVATHARVLAEAVQEMHAKGPDGISVAGVMARAGLTHGGFYAHFGSRNDLVAQVVTKMFDDAATRFDGAAAATADPAATLAAYVEDYLSPRHRNARDRGCPLAALAGDAVRLTPAARHAFGAGTALLLERIAKLLGALGNDDPPAAAAALLSTLVGGLSLSRAVTGPDLSDAVLRDVAASIRRSHDLQGHPAENAS